LFSLVAATSVVGCKGAKKDPKPTLVASAVPTPSASAPANVTESAFDKQTKSLRSFVANFNKHDAEAVARAYAADAVFAELGEQGGDAKGSAEILADYKAIFAGFEDATMSVTRSWHIGDAVLVEFVEGGTGSGDSEKGPRKSYGYVGARLLWFDDAGLIKREQTYADELTTEVQLGAAAGPLAKLEVRPLQKVPAWSGTWEQHRASGSSEEAKLVPLRQKLYAELTSGGEKDFLGMMTDDVVLSANDEAKDAKGKAEIGAVFKEWKTMFSDIKMVATHTWACGEFAIFEGTFSGKHTGPWGPLKATNKNFTSHFIDVTHITKDGKVDRMWTYANNGELLTHLGLRAPRR
jgi:ketosteroid isomerase-like protein